MKIVVDTNIVFSGILNQKSRIGKVLIGEHKFFNFYSCYYLQKELINHYSKISHIAKKSIDRIIEIEKCLTKNIKFINENIIPKTIILESEKLVKDVDFDDIFFVALTKHLNAKLWTGDYKLIDSLKSKGFTQIIKTHEILSLIEKFKRENE